MVVEVFAHTEVVVFADAVAVAVVDAVVVVVADVDVEDFAVVVGVGLLDGSALVLGALPRSGSVAKLSTCPGRARILGLQGRFRVAWRPF